MTITPEEIGRLYQVLWKPQMHPREDGGPNCLFSEEACGDLFSETSRFPALPGLAAYEKALTELDKMCIVYVLAAFFQMGFKLEPYKCFSRSEIASELGIVDQYHQLLERMLNMLVEEGILRHEGGVWEVIASPGDLTPKGHADAIFCPEAEAEITLLTRCGPRLAEVLQGRCAPLSLLFPDADMSVLARLYRDSPVLHFMNGLAEKVVLSAVERMPSGSCCRILEIGAGTGGATSRILPRLCGYDVEYVFTDVAHVFLNRARIEFKDYSFVDYRILDIEKDAQSQGFELQRYDIIIATNVLHATRDLRQTLHHIRRLLSPGGVLVLLEGTAPVRWMDLVFGLTAGWSRFRDYDLRPSYPLISSLQWKALLREAGFVETASVSPEEVQNSAERRNLLHQSLIVAREPVPGAGVEVQGDWLVFADRGGLGSRLRERLSSSKETCTLVHPGKCFEELRERELVIDPAEPEHYQRLLKTLENPPRVVVHLWSLDIPPIPALPTGAEADDCLSYSRIPDAASVLGCGSTLHLIQALSEEYFDLPSLWLITRGAQSVEAYPDAPGVFQSPLWGMAKVIALEKPELHCVRIDLDPNGGVEEDRALFEEIGNRFGVEDQLAFRNGTRYAARLAPYHPVFGAKSNAGMDSNVHSPRIFREDAGYLITGGLGGLGLLVARWMVERGARFLKIVGRSGPDERANSVIKEMERAGARVGVSRADVSDANQVARILIEIEDELPPLRGIVHAAGIVDDGLILQLDQERFMRVMAPKVKGAWHLHVLTVSRGLPLDFFVFFSSLASLVGNAGQAGYAAANAFMDCLAHYRQAHGMPGLSINWGAWSEVGIVANRPLAAEWLKETGIGNISPGLGLRILDLLLSQTCAQAGAAPVDWTKFRKRYRLKNDAFFSLMAGP
jgi:SAM-dependent methyltransferase